MKGGTLQIAWHGSSDPVLTLHFHPASGLLATGGADHDIKLWSVCLSDDNKAGPTATYQASLSYHTAAVNVLRFSPAGDQLASGADGGELLIWRYIEGSEIAHSWKVSKSLRFHVKDVLDLEWSSDGTFLITGSVDNSVLIWDLSKGVPHQIIKDHLHYVQGVTWDPAGEFVASISGDRTCRVYSNRKQYTKSKGQDKHTFTCLHVLLKAEQQKKETKDGEIEAKEDTTAKHHLFHDETLPSFFRRLAWSPDGSFLLVPAGLHKFSPESSPSNTTYIISRKDLSRPALQLPAASKATVAVCFCPLLFTLRSDGNLRENESSEFFKLPYRLVFAVATLNSLFIYDTQNACPLGVFAGLHYAAITDIAWSSDGKFLAVSSQDGFCSLVSFDDGELGEPVPFHEIPSHIAKNLPQNSLSKINKDGESIEKKRESEKVEKEEDAIDDTRQSPTTKTPEKIMAPLDNIIVTPPFLVEAAAKSEQCSKLVHNVNRNSEVATISTIPRPQKQRRITPMCISAESIEKKRESEKVEKEEDAIHDTRQSPTTETPEKMRTPLQNFAVTSSPPFPVEEAAKSEQPSKLVHIVDKPLEVATISTTRPQKQRRITPMCISGESTEKKRESEVEKKEVAINDTRQSPSIDTLEKTRTPLDNTVATPSPFPVEEAANLEQPSKLMHTDKNSEVAAISTIPRPQKQRRITPMCISEAIKPSSSECPIAPEAVSSERRV